MSSFPEKIKISVITATLNSVETLSYCLDSVANQDYENLEHILIDGASTDGTDEMVKNYSQQLSCVVREPDNGIYDALNKGLARATGDVIGFLHADDVFADQRVISRIAQAFLDPQVDAVYGDLEYVSGGDDRVLRYWRSGLFERHKLNYGWMPPHPTLYIRRQIYEDLGGFDMSYKIAADYDFMLRFFSTPDLHSVYIPHVLVRMRTGGASNRSLSNIILKSTEDLRALRQNEVGGVFALTLKNFGKISQFWVRDK